MSRVEKVRRVRRHGGARRNGITYRTLLAAGLTQAEAKERGLVEDREEYLGRAAERRDAVRKLRAEGMTIRAIAQQLGLSVGTVHRYAKAD